MREDRQAESSLSNEHITGMHFKWRTGGVSFSFIIAGGNQPLPLIIQNNLCAAQNMTCRCHCDSHITDLHLLAILKGRGAVGKPLTITLRHNIEGLRCGDDMLMTITGMVSMSMSDES